MSDISISPKPESVSMDEISNLIYRAHQINRDEGLNIFSGHMTPDEITQYLGDSGICYVAIDGTRLVGTASYRIVDRNAWYHKGELPEACLIAVDPAYRGQGISKRLCDQLAAHAAGCGYSCMLIHVASTNKRAIHAYLKAGYVLVHYFRRSRKAEKGEKQFDRIIMMKWIGKEPFPRWYIKARYELQHIRTIASRTIRERKRSRQ